LALLNGLPDARPVPPATGLERIDALTPDQVADAVTALSNIDEALAERAVARFLSLPAIYDMDSLLLPTALILMERTPDPEPGAAADLRRAVLAHLEARIAEPLEPPADWTRDARIACSCPHCRGLGRFLSSPTESVWQFKAAEAERSHVAQSVARHHCDLELQTDKRGRPYTLVCTKTQASFERRVHQRKLDLDHRMRLSG
jgi:hypothetical protein